MKSRSESLLSPKKYAVPHHLPAVAHPVAVAAAAVLVAEAVAVAVPEDIGKDPRLILNLVVCRERVRYLDMFPDVP